MAKEMGEMLAIQEEEARKAGDTDRIFQLRRLRGIINEAERTGVLTPCLEPESQPIERTKQEIEIPSFSPEQLEGLKEVGFDFTHQLSAKSMDQLLIEEAGHFGNVNSSDSFRGIVPPARQVAVRSAEPALPGSNKLGFDDQLQMVADFERELKGKRLGQGKTLEGVQFTIDHASTYSQLDIAYLKETGNPLLVAQFARTKDATSASSVASVGRNPDALKLHVLDWLRHFDSRHLWAVPVAVPAGK